MVRPESVKTPLLAALKPPVPAPLPVATTKPWITTTTCYYSSTVLLLSLTHTVSHVICKSTLCHMSHVKTNSEPDECGGNIS
jgi:hypothetical protein